MTQVSKALTDSHLPVLVDIGSCNLHKVHNAFGRSLLIYGKDAEELALKLFYWFKHSAARREDFKAIQFELELEDVFLLRHVSSQWLSLQPAVTRILSQWTALSSYFKHLTDNDKTVGSNDNYKAIMHLMDNPSVFLQLLFIADIAPIFSDFLRFLLH